MEKREIYFKKLEKALIKNLKKRKEFQKKYNSKKRK
jgi:hypothetical protein